MNSEARQLQSVVFTDGLIELSWSDNGRNRFHPIRLRDVCRSDACGDPYRASPPGILQLAFPHSDLIDAMTRSRIESITSAEIGFARKLPTRI